MSHNPTRSDTPDPAVTSLHTASRIEAMLAEATLRLVVDAAAELGISITSRTGLRWGIHGRGGECLLTVRVRGRLHTTVPELRRWLARTSRDVPATKPECQGGLDPQDADRVLRAFGLSRRVTQ